MMRFVTVLAVLGFCRSALAFTSAELPPEPCPEDSVATAGGCACDYSLCKEPPCSYTLKQASNATHTPGHCCPVYTCEGCPESKRLGGACPCLPGAVIGPRGDCRCSDPYETLVNGTCQCNRDLCELPALCDDRSVAVKEVRGCCERVRCVACPDDSYPTAYNDLDVEDKCVCFSCPSKKCGERQQAVVMRKGKNLPGMCCDIYRCENVKGCLANGTLYAEGETWTSSSGDKCKCQFGISFCSSMSSSPAKFKPCLSSGVLRNHLESWEEDICTNCSCYDGAVKCISHMCDVLTSRVNKPGCPPLMCNKACEHGYRLNKQGCEVCKCKMDKTEYEQSRLDALLKEYNLTETDVVELVKNLVRTRLAGTTSTTDATARSTTAAPVATATSAGVPVTTICFTENKNALSCSYNCFLEYAFPAFAIGVVCGGLALFFFLRCSEKNRQKYKMAYTYKPVGKETVDKNLVDKNLNFSSPIKSKTFELQSYSEKKNVF